MGQRAMKKIKVLRAMKWGGMKASAWEGEGRWR